jgi:ADP-heptose:LPS heptosyltransferase
LSASISCSEALEALQRGERLPPDSVRTLGEEQPDEFFRTIIEALSDSFDPRRIAAYEELMTAWIPKTPRMQPRIPKHVETVCVLSRVTLGSDIKITSIILDAMKRRFPEASIVFVANRKSAELFETDARIKHLEADYPRSGPVSRRIDFAHELRRKLEAPNRILIDPDSRMTQLGLLPVCELEHYFHFPSRLGDSAPNLTQLTQNWLQETFGISGHPYIAPARVPIEGDAPRAAISLGVGGNDSKRLGSDFETKLLRELGVRYQTLWIDRGAGGEEARRVTAAVEASGTRDRVRYWEGGFASFASIISQCDFYAGYDSAGQHAAAAANIPLTSYFGGAPSQRFVERWSPAGNGPIRVVPISLNAETEWTLDNFESSLAENSN